MHLTNYAFYNTFYLKIIQIFARKPYREIIKISNGVLRKRDSIFLISKHGKGYYISNACHTPIEHLPLCNLSNAC